MLKPRRTKYREGQWFAVPLTTDGYAIGLLARGKSPRLNGLGFFFGPKFDTVPTAADIENLTLSDALMIRWFSCRGLALYRWPFIQSDRIFRRTEWPIPQFGSYDALDETRGWLITYPQDAKNFVDDISRIHCDAKLIHGLWQEGSAGHESVQIAMTVILEENRYEIAYARPYKRR